MSGKYSDGSRLYSAIQRLNDSFRPIGHGFRSSRLKRCFDRLTQSFDRLASVTGQSRIVRWLTAEPEPDVIVIDLRETWTVGPIITLLDRVLPHGERTWTGSRTRRMVERIAVAFENAPVRLASILFLGVLAAQFALTWASSSALSLGVLCFLAAPALLGLRVDWTWDELTESNVGQLASSLLVPPEPPDDDDRN